MGCAFHSNGDPQYDGEWVNDMREGKGTDYMGRVKYYTGEWKDDQPNGQGTLNCARTVYEGGMVRGMRHGEGVEYYKHHGVKTPTIMWQGVFSHNALWDGRAYRRDGTVYCVIHDGKLVTEGPPDSRSESSPESPPESSSS